MVKEIGRREVTLRRAGLIIGILGIVEICIWGIFNTEGGPSWEALMPAIAFAFIYTLPLLVGLFISWKWSFGGGITLIVIAVIWLVFIATRYFLIPAINPVSELILYTVTFFAILGLPYLVPGILFVLAAKSSGKYW
ncbi:MAG: hypothetical protein JXA17_03380 [Dehalococcoidales bacterium]|nr:hypothetical protein [Dehalococcoidales bacterium]